MIDQLDIRDGFVRPYLTMSENKIALNKNTPNIKYGSPEYSFFLIY